MAEAEAVKITTFVWKGSNKQGKRIKGELNATNSAAVKAGLRNQGITPISVKKKRSSFFSKTNKKITPADIAVFTRQLATMLRAGIPLVQSFDIISKGYTNFKMQSLVAKIKKDVESGLPLAKALDKYPLYFGNLYCSLVNAGEQSGSLDKMLARVATYKEKIESLKGKIKKAMFYPAAVVAVAIVVTTILLIFVIPEFESVYKGFGAELPAFTQFVINISRWVKSYWWVILVIMMLMGWLLATMHRKSERFAFLVDKIQLQIPIIGGILKKAIIARYARTLATTFAAGLPLVNALESVAGSTGNRIFAQGVLQIRDSISTGQQLQSAMRLTALFPPMVVQMVAIGEESGSLEQMLDKVADFYEEEVNNAVDNLSSLLEPMIMVVLGILVGGLVVAMYLPIFKLGSVI